ncbi:hypothetical protein AZE42_12252 [Rhizopogon vesiculosus]|uniref:Uncharacterized protein n=1 Tax=Rhizopogon vesiculosus TaxID=180088 RepID=A0A1J8Q7D7_9AGAM|nr:hypothetical protein AZE42_12252 [Rhizopogon vesiculosus]
MSIVLQAKSASERWRSDEFNRQFILAGSLDELYCKEASEEEERPPV